MLKALSLILLFLAPQAFAAFGMDPVPRELLNDKTGVLDVPNMPRVRSQDSLGVCYSFVAATLLDQANCVTNNVADCSKVPDSEKNSPLDMARYSVELPDEVDGSDRFNYEGLSEGGSSALAMYNALRTQQTARESCAPFDQVAAKGKTPQETQQLELAMWKKFKDSYEAHKKKAKECANCGLEYATAKTQELKENYNLKASNLEILEAFSQDTYGKFLDRLLVPDTCWDLKNSVGNKGGWKVKQFPESGQKAEYNSAIGKIKELLTKKRPVSLGFCAQETLTVKSMKACGALKDPAGNDVGAGHEIIIKGYRKVCKSANDCYEALQIQNSWGESWQSSNSDGWVDAKVLLNRSFYEPGAMTWLEPSQ
ncbi:hypothetical protein [Bdellovibrio bacteriovorus]|uniref:Peptidase C1A papain C-terminal domain-containing protein n=1 Tax=Bdellovibrio bacteriovorus str. Tiberius TaxID=1069642 RepID=K7ZDS3_BDEBC|nr:hypothetical protein [Bdellovibrio bacteriovorus]AFX99791.1 hypothetical protein Bdt_0079 [Bdellovibrio bacteriovorus str. Tiberius]